MLIISSSLPFRSNGFLIIFFCFELWTTLSLFICPLRELLVSQPVTSVSVFCCSVICTSTALSVAVSSCVSFSVVHHRLGWYTFFCHVCIHKSTRPVQDVHALLVPFHLLLDSTFCNPLSDSNILTNTHTFALGLNLCLLTYLHVHTLNIQTLLNFLHLV